MSSAFWSGFASSAFSVGNKGYGGTTGRTLIMATVGGTVSQLTGGKFANGAVSGAFVQLFNGEGLKWFNPWTWWSKETSSDISDQAIKKAYCTAQKKGQWACKKVLDYYSPICHNSESICYDSWVTYFGSCSLGTLDCDEKDEYCKK